MLTDKAARCRGTLAARDAEADEIVILVHKALRKQN
jgi:hypothetical protein